MWSRGSSKFTSPLVGEVDRRSGEGAYLSEEYERVKEWKYKALLLQFVLLSLSYPSLALGATSPTRGEVKQYIFLDKLDGFSIQPNKAGSIVSTQKP